RPRAARARSGSSPRRARRRSDPGPGTRYPCRPSRLQTEAETGPLRPCRSHPLLRQKDRDAFAVNRPAVGPALVAAVLERPIRAFIVARVITRAHDGHRAVVQRVAADALVAG